MEPSGNEILNARTGQRMIFRQTAARTNGALLQIESIHPTHQPPEPEHVHPRQQSSTMMVSGTLRFRVGNELKIVRAGETLEIEPGTPHFFWNESGEEARAIQEFRPALRTEEFFRTLFALAGDGKLDDKGMPSLLQLAVMVPAFGEEIRPTSPPWPLLRALTGVLAPIARMRGYASTYPSPATAR